MVLKKYFFVLIIGFVVQAAAQMEPWPWQPNDADVSMLIWGDTNIQNRDNPVEGFKYLLPTFEQADLRICNLEGALAGTSKDSMILDIPHKSNWRHSEPEMVRGLVDANIDAVSVANNVTWPWMALMKSLEVLEEHNIPYAGGGENLDAAHEPVILEKNGTTVGFLAYACTVFPFQHAATEKYPGIATVRINTSYQPPPKYDKPGTPPIIVTIPVEEELKRMEQDIAELKKKVDIVIASYHWGRSHHPELIDYQVTVAHAAIDAGADVIMGHGNHEIAAIEVYNQKPVFYGLGNMVFDWWQVKDRPHGLLAKIDVAAGKMNRVSVLPVQRDDNNDPHLLDPNAGAGAALFERLKSRSGNPAFLTIQGKEIKVDIE